MARVGSQNLDLINIKNLKNKVNNGDMVCFYWGEIDCRAHLCKNQNYEIHKEITDHIVSQYFEAIRLNVEQYDNLKTIIPNVVPATRITPWLIQVYGPQTNTPFPFIGTDEQRKTVVIYLNHKLKEYCTKYNYIFLDTYDKYCDPDGYMDVKLKDNTCHIGNEIYLVEFLKKII